MNARIAALLVGNLLTTMGMLMFTGMANELADDLRLTPTELGPLLAVAPLVLAVASPFLAIWTSRFRRRSLLVAAMAIGAASHLAAAVSGSMLLLAIARGVTGISTGLYAPQAAATAMLLGPVEQRGRIVSLIFIGFAAAHTIGLPAATWLSSVIGWRTTVAGVGVSLALIAAWLHRTIPQELPPAPLEKSAWGELARHPVMVLTVVVTAVQISAQFVLYSFIAPYSRDVLAATPAAIGILFAMVGAGGIAGNLVATRIADRIGPVRLTAYAISAMLIAVLAWPLTALLTASTPMAAYGIAVAAMTLWGIGTFPAASGQQVRLVNLNARLATVALAVNTSATYGGSAIGTMIGSGLLAGFGYGALSWGSVALFAVALGLHWASTRTGRHRAATQ
jgi:predicted MFS family arabinose efflux permease